VKERSQLVHRTRLLSGLVDGRGFGQSIRTINGAIECDGGNPAQVADRIARYKRFIAILDVNPGQHLSC
jgi:chitinase